MGSGVFCGLLLLLLLRVVAVRLEVRQLCTALGHSSGALHVQFISYATLIT